MQILNVLYEERFGGPPARVLQVASQLRCHGFQTVVAIPRGDPTFASRLKAANIASYEFDLVRLRNTVNPTIHARFVGRFWANVMTLRRLIRSQKIQVVHTNGLMNLQSPLAAHLERVPLVWHLNDINTPWPLRLLFRPLVYRWADCIVAAAHAVGQHYFPDRSFTDERFRVLYAPVDTTKFRPDVHHASVRSEIGIADDCPVIGTVANLHPGKGVHYLLEAAPLIKQRFPTVKFLIVGAKLDTRQAYWSFLRRRTEALGITENVIFTGRRDDVPQVMAGMTVYVHPSKSEACPMAVLEASASGLPVVATDVGGTRELVEDGVTGVLVESKSPAQIAQAVLHILADSARAQAMGRKGAERMRTRFSLEACVAEHIRVYETALKRKSVA